MAKIVIASLKTKPKSGRTASTVTEQRVRDIDGLVKTLRKIDAGSRTFGDDLQYVFGKNVTKARRDNKRTVGVNDVAVVKR